MLNTLKLIAIAAVPTAFIVSGASLMSPDVLAHAGSGENGCQIVVDDSGDSILVESFFTAKKSGTARYSLGLTGKSRAGSTSVSQGNAMRVVAGETSKLSSLMLDGNKTYELDLEVEMNGKRYSCSEDIGTRI